MSLHAEGKSFHWPRVVPFRRLLVMSTSAKHPASGYRYIANVAGIRGGQAIVEGTRIAVHDVIALLQTGDSIETVIANCFPTLTRSQVYECLAYYEDHRGEIDVLVSRQMQTGA